ncbi:MAG: flagellar biosynthesis protein FlhB [Solirubrobacteraceae bacterium]|nr:flagellar biosynthesis protein FlhB [Solirubrobacteraceae bacterium]
MSDSGDKTEEATPKRKQEAREKGQVARSTDLNGAVVLLVGTLVLGATFPRIWADMQEGMRNGLLLTAHADDVVRPEGVAGLGAATAQQVFSILAPLAVGVVIAAVVVNLAQVGMKPSPKALIPDFKKLDPIKGAKNVFGMNSIVEGVKSLAKMLVVGGVVAAVLLPRIDEVAALTGISPAQFANELGRNAMTIARNAAVVYLVIGAFDVGWQRHRHRKQMKMSLSDVRREFRQQELPSEVKQQQRQRAAESSRNRMMAAIPQADVVVTNPTHFAVALAYDPEKSAPTVVAKGQDLIALRIRAIAREHDVQIVENKPLARALHRQVEVGHAIPEELFQAVAEVLAFVYRVDRRRRARLA